MIRQLSEATEKELQEVLRWWRAIPKHTLGIQQGGTRHIDLDLYLFELTEAMGATTTDQASADIETLEGEPFEDDAIVRDPIPMFTTLVSGKRGYCHRQYGKWWVIQAECP